MVRHNKEEKEYNSRGAIHRDFETRNIGFKPDSKNTDKPNLKSRREEINYKIKEKEKLIKLTKAFINAPKSEGGLSREQGNRRIALFEQDIRNLKRELEDAIKEEIQPIETISEPTHKESYICQFCFKHFEQVYGCPKCGLMLCDEHLSSHSCIKSHHIEDKYKIETIDELKVYRNEDIKHRINLSETPKVEYRSYLRWDWSKTSRGILRFATMLFAFSLIFQNIEKINNAFLKFIPVGLISLIIISVLLLNHFHKLIKWDTTWIKSTKKLLHIVIHIGMYLIVASLVLSLPLTMVSIVDKLPNKGDIPDIGQINVSTVTTLDENTNITINDPNNHYVQRIQRMLNSVDKDVLRHIKSVNVIYDEAELNNICKTTAWGCASNLYDDLGGSSLIKSDIYVISGDHYAPIMYDNGSYIKSCGSFDYTLYHEIGHVVYAIKNGYQPYNATVEENFADSYADKFRVKETC